MSEIKVSVLIPVYGVEKYIEKCVRSLFDQTLTDGIEFIFTDDCTPDSSIKIVEQVLEEYPHRKSQVKMLRHSENQGLAEARVTGLRAASGEYVIHCDSDDWVHPNMYELLYTEAKKNDADIVGCDAYHVFPNRTIIKKEAFDLNQDKLVSELILSRSLDGYLWNRMIRRSFYIKGEYRADKGTTLLEDMAVTVPIHASTKKVAYVPQPLYYYRRTDEQSMSAALSNRNVSSAIAVLEKLKELPLKQQWLDAIDARQKSFLFSRALSFRGYNYIGWREIELQFINSHKLPLIPVQKVSCILLSHKLDCLQYLLMLSNKFFNPNLWIKRIKHRFHK